MFTGPEGGLLNINNLRDHAWYGTLKKAELRRRTMYQTRHTFASNALAAGEAPSWVAAQLGHSTPGDALQRLRPLHPESDPAGRLSAARPDDGADGRGDGSPRERCRTAEILPLTRIASG